MSSVTDVLDYHNTSNYSLWAQSQNADTYKPLWTNSETHPPCSNNITVYVLLQVAEVHTSHVL